MTYVCPTCKGCGLVANDEAHSPWYDFLAAHPHYKDVSIPLDPADVGIDFRPLRCPACGGEGRMEKLPVKGDMRVWAVRNPPDRPDFFPASDVAMAMLAAARAQRRGVHVYAGATLQALAESGRRQTS